MSITFSTDEIFEMAQEIERSGAMFYREAAKNTSDKETKKMLLGMAGIEEDHLETFEEMRGQLSELEKIQTSFAPENQLVLYFQAMADARGCEGKITSSEELTGSETIKEILEIALNSEKESVVFYFSLKSLMSSRAGGDKVEAIIYEELDHITALLNKLNTVSCGSLM